MKMRKFVGNALAKMDGPIMGPISVIVRDMEASDIRQLYSLVLGNVPRKGQI